MWFNLDNYCLYFLSVGNSTNQQTGEFRWYYNKMVLYRKFINTKCFCHDLGLINHVGIARIMWFPDHQTLTLTHDLVWSEAAGCDVLLNVESISYDPNRDRYLLRLFINGEVGWKLGIIT